MKPIISGCVVVAALIATGLVQDTGGVVNTAAAQALQKTSREVPKFEVDPTWPKLPAKWVFGQVSSVSVDENGHAIGFFRVHGIRPKCADRIEHRGMRLPADLFARREIEAA